MIDSFKIGPDGLPEILKTPDAVLDYTVSWAEWLALAGGVSIASATAVSDSGLTVVSSTVNDDATAVIVWLSGGVLGTRYKVTVAIHTTGATARIDAREFFVRIVER